MNSESEKIHARMDLYREMKTHPSWSTRQLAQKLSKSEAWVRKWRNRFEEGASLGFAMFRSQSSAPKTRHSKMTPEIIKAVIEAREEKSKQYHRPAGPILIKQALTENEAFKDRQNELPQSSRTIYKILHLVGILEPSKKVKHQELVLSEPMEEWEIDFCVIRLEDGWFEFFLVVDRGTSRVIHIDGCEGYNAVSALEAVYKLFLLHGKPKRIRLDRDSRFVGSWSRDSYPSPLLRFLYAVEVEPVVCPPRRPDKKAYVERCIRTFKHEWLARFSLNTLADVYEVMAGFSHYHNTERIHMGRACNGRTPDEAFPSLPALPYLPEVVNPNRWVDFYDGRCFRRHVTSNGTIQVDKHIHYVNRDLKRQLVLVHLDANTYTLKVTCQGVKVGEYPISHIHPGSMEMHEYLVHLREEARTIQEHRRALWQRISDAA